MSSTLVCGSVWLLTLPSGIGHSFTYSMLSMKCLQIASIDLRSVSHCEGWAGAAGREWDGGATLPAGDRY